MRIGILISFLLLAHLDHVVLVQEKWKPFHTFALAGQIKFMDGLLENGYDIELVDKVHVFPFHFLLGSCNFLNELGWTGWVDCAASGSHWKERGRH